VIHSLARASLSIAIVIVLGEATVARAQDAPAAAGQPPAQSPATIPAHRPWHGSLNIGLSAASGAQEQRSFQLGGSLVHPLSDGGRFVASASRQYQKVTFPSASLLADRTSLIVGADADLTTHTIAMVRSMYLKDVQFLVDSRFEELAGYGLRFQDKDKKAIDLQVLPGLSFYKEDLAFADPSGWKSAYGFFEKFSAKLTNAWSIENSFRYRHDIADVKRSIESVATLDGAITKTLGVELEYQYNYESVVPPDFPNYLSLFVAGIKFKF
jgi:putative salt-induced outer membrane protein YdiY